MPGVFLTLFSKQFSIAMPYKVICLSFERLHLEWCRFSCVDIVFDAILQIHAMPGDLFFECLHHKQCRLMCVDIVFEAIFNCDAMPGVVLTLFSKQFSIAMPCKVIKFVF